MTLFAKAIAGAAAGLGLLAAASIANAADAARENYNQAGTHQFYVWCTGSTASYTTTADGANAEEAQMKAYEEAKAQGKTTCWPIWQGKAG
ncbi:MAG TPA: hypothetical protein PL096_13125 [Micropepsaceae bacterium]|nr:hypothetical protein [Micropepsaceae bacterium]